MDCHPTPSQLQYLVWNRLNFNRISFEGPSSIIWWCNYGTSLGSRLLWNADVLATRGCIHKSSAPIHWEKGHDTATKWQWQWEWKKRTLIASFQWIVSVAWCQFVKSDLWTMIMLCEDWHMSVWWYIEIRENEFAIWVFCLFCFQCWGCGMKHHPWNLCTLCTTERQ